MLDALKRFRDANWPEINARLADYARAEVRKLRWRTPQDSLPEGKTAEDLALGAIQKTFEGLLTSERGKGLRKWDPSRVPDLLYFLKGVVDSDISDLVNRREHADFNYSAKLDQEDASSLLEQAIEGSRGPDGGESDTSPEAILTIEEERKASDDRYNSLMGALCESSAADDEELMVLMGVEEIINSGEEVTPKAITERTGLSYDKVKNVRKRLARKAHSFLPKGGKNEET